MASKGLIYIWASAIGAMLLIYILFPYLSFILGTVDYFVEFLFGQLGVTDSGWYDIYKYWGPILRSTFGMLSFVLFVSFIIYIVVNSARREPSEWWV